MLITVQGSECLDHLKLPPHVVPVGVLPGVPSLLAAQSLPHLLGSHVQVQSDVRAV